MVHSCVSWWRTLGWASLRRNRRNCLSDSTRVLSRVTTGMTPNDYIRKIRLEKAAELLLTTNMTAAEVAYKVGFDDQYYFSKSFKRYFGQPPSQYRKGSEKSQEES